MAETKRTEQIAAFRLEPGKTGGGGWAYGGSSVATLGANNALSYNAGEANGKAEMIETGNFDPAFGGKMSLEAPRKFRDCWLTEKAAGKYFVHTAQTDKTTKFRGLRAGRFGLKAVEDVTIDLTKPINHWNRLFGGVL